MLIAGVDEAGRGPIAGPVFAAAVILPDDYNDSDIKDSKKLTAKKRNFLFDKIIEIAIDWSFCQISSKEIDKINILQASLLAMRKAVLALKIQPQKVLIDGNMLPEGLPDDLILKNIINGDNINISISAASIIAKVLRDKYMLALAERYPNYNFNKHKGYPTKEHKLLIQRYGLIPEHRLTFAPIKSFIKSV